MEEIGRIVAICRSGAIHPTIASAIELTCFTVQRRSTISKARVAAFGQAGGECEGLWTIDPVDMKVKARKDGKPRPPHYVPLPEPAYRCVLRQLERIGPEARWLFPQIRRKYWHSILSWIDENTLSHMMRDIPCVDATLHDLRRGFATHGEQLLGNLRAETKAILAHVGEASTSLITRPGSGSDVTSLHYAMHDGTHRTWPVMRAWAAAVEKQAIEAAKTLPSAEELRQQMREARLRREKQHGQQRQMAVAAE